MKTWNTLIFGIVLILSANANSASISYDSNNRPTEFLDLSLNGINYDVTVIWEQSFDSVYSIDPLFWGDQNGAQNAALTLMTELINDNYQVGTSLIGPFILTPYELNAFTIVSRTVNLGAQGLAIDSSSSERTTSWDYVGYTVWEASAVPIPAAVWLFGSGLIGLVSLAKRKS